jgi:hypothetical protein
LTCDILGASNIPFFPLIIVDMHIWTQVLLECRRAFTTSPAKLHRYAMDLQLFVDIQIAHHFIGQYANHMGGAIG